MRMELLYFIKVFVITPHWNWNATMNYGIYQYDWNRAFPNTRLNHKRKSRSDRVLQNCPRLLTAMLLSCAGTYPAVKPTSHSIRKCSVTARALWILDIMKSLVCKYFGNPFAFSRPLVPPPSNYNVHLGGKCRFYSDEGKNRLLINNPFCIFRTLNFSPSKNNLHLRKKN